MRFYMPVIMWFALSHSWPHYRLIGRIIQIRQSSIEYDMRKAMGWDPSFVLKKTKLPTNLNFADAMHVWNKSLKPEAHGPQRSPECTAMKAIFSQNTVNVACKKK